ncbi:MAG: BatA domain-containing protein [Chthoniobacterales bacterium]
MSGLFFANLAGLWALIGVPAVLLIHFLQRESRRVVTGTLFLLEQLAPESAQGRRFDRLRNSVSLWLQLLAILLITWLLAEPRWIRHDSAQTVAIVLDDSASMSAFADDARQALADRASSLSSAAAHTDWTLLDSHGTRLYHGPNSTGLLAALKNWKPTAPEHDPAPAFRTAQSLVRQKGAVLYLTDHAAAVPPRVECLAVGRPFNNVGFTGLRADAAGWQVLVKNNSDQPATRTWKLDGQPRGTVELGPNGMAELTSQFPGLVERCTLQLEADRFTLDDTLPVQRPCPKQLGIYSDPGTPFDDFFKAFAASISDRSPTGRDLRLVRFDPLYPKPLEGGSIVFVDQPGVPGKLLTGSIIAENHPLVHDLVWQGLLVNETLVITPEASDEPLVSQDGRPLLFLRRIGKSRSLMVNFDLRYSNATRLPAFVLALHRFTEIVRAERSDTESLNVETRQLLPDDSRAPEVPGFFERPQLKAAAHFADSRETDFRQASSSDPVRRIVTELRQRNSEEDFLTPVWVLLLLATIAGSWLLTGPKTRGVA